MLPCASGGPKRQRLIRSDRDHPRAGAESGVVATPPVRRAQLCATKEVALLHRQLSEAEKQAIWQHLGVPLTDVGDAVGIHQREDLRL